MITGRSTASATSSTAAGRAGWFDHLVHAGGHYNRTQADRWPPRSPTTPSWRCSGRAAAGSIAGFVLAGNTALQLQLVGAIQDAVPGQDGSDLASSVAGAIGARRTTGIIGLVGFLLVGIGAIDKLRVGMDIIWRGEPDQPDFLGDRLKDLVVLLGLAGAGVVSIALTTGTTAASRVVFDALGIDQVPGFFLLTAALGIGLALVGDTLMSVACSRACRAPRTHRAMLLPAPSSAPSGSSCSSWRRVLPADPQRQRDVVGVRRLRRADRLDQRGRPVRLLHGLVDRDPPCVRALGRPVLHGPPARPGCPTWCWSTSGGPRRRR